MPLGNPSRRVVLGIQSPRSASRWSSARVGNTHRPSTIRVRVVSESRPSCLRVVPELRATRVSFTKSPCQTSIENRGLALELAYPRYRYRNRYRTHLHPTRRRRLRVGVFPPRDASGSPPTCETESTRATPPHGCQLSPSEPCARGRARSTVWGGSTAERPRGSWRRSTGRWGRTSSERRRLWFSRLGRSGRNTTA